MPRRIAIVFESVQSCSQKHFVFRSEASLKIHITKRLDSDRAWCFFLALRHSAQGWQEADPIERQMTCKEFHRAKGNGSGKRAQVSHHEEHGAMSSGLDQSA